MSLQTHFSTVQEKHHRLEGMISSELSRPYPDLVALQTLKKQKLLLKEELEHIRTQTLQRQDAA